MDGIYLWSESQLDTRPEVFDSMAHGIDLRVPFHRLAIGDLHDGIAGRPEVLRPLFKIDCAAGEGHRPVAIFSADRLFISTN
jgi:hypothetical protein